MITADQMHPQSALRAAITSATRADEGACLEALLPLAQLDPGQSQRVQVLVEDLVLKVRSAAKKYSALDAILEKYDLSSAEGIALMCVAEALLRIPDTETVDKLLTDKLSSSDWLRHLDANGSLFTNAVTWSLMLTAKIYANGTPTDGYLASALKNLTKKSSGLAIRPMVKSFMTFLGDKFVMGQSINEALKRAKAAEAQAYRYSYDMLGEAARTADDAANYFAAYANAIDAIGEQAAGRGPIESPGISIKLSALHPRYEVAQKQRVMDELVPRVLALVLMAKKYDINLTIDAEEADRLELSLDVIAAVFRQEKLNGWEGFGIAVQSYQKRAPFVLDYLAALSRECGRKIMLRLIKGAYWDSEIKQSQELGLSAYPVFTRKHATDVSFLACARKITENLDAFYPQFATHNAYSIAVVFELMGDKPFEFQCLHGMGQKIYDHLVGENIKNVPCRIYAPVGTHKDLLGYLMRRLLENGANTSFVNLISHPNTPMTELLLNPVARIKALASKPHPRIPLPRDIFGIARQNSAGIDLSDVDSIAMLKNQMQKTFNRPIAAASIVAGKMLSGEPRILVSPADITIELGTVTAVDEQGVDQALALAYDAFKLWNTVSIDDRAAILLRAADLLEAQMPYFMAILLQEAGKTIAAAESEVREAIDFCRYYAVTAQKTLKPITLPGPTGELNQLFMQGRGVFVCISPWNFPLAIFLGQVVAALVAGNTVIAKPADQTPLIAFEVVKLLHQAGIPVKVLHLLIGRGSFIGGRLLPDDRVAGVMFTGSTETAVIINKTLANRKGAIVPFVAETGGQNAMIVDSSALPEQVIKDVIRSAFDSAGQRCSALRILYVQEDAAENVIGMLKGAMAEISLGNPSLLCTDVGPVIDDASRVSLQAHFDQMMKEGRLIYQASAAKMPGHFFAPCAFEIDSAAILTREVFGPFLHVIRYKASELKLVLQEINATGYGLTLGIHSRIGQTADTIFKSSIAGNTYVNRNIIGATVGVQPFGGAGLSGTGPKAGGPHYLYRLCSERTLSVNTTAAGGNASLLILDEGDV